MGWDPYTLTRNMGYNGIHITSVSFQAPGLSSFMSINGLNYNHKHSEVHVYHPLSHCHLTLIVSSVLSTSLCPAKHFPGNFTSPFNFLRTANFWVLQSSSSVICHSQQKDWEHSFFFLEAHNHLTETLWTTLGFCRVGCYKYLFFLLFC